MATCKTCPKELWAQSRTGYCRKCWPKSPERRAHMSGLMKRKWQDPAKRAEYTAAGMANLNTPGTREKALATNKERKTWLKAGQYVTPEMREKANKKQIATKLAHIPSEYREQYRHITKTLRFTAAEATAIILQQQERDLELFRRKLQETVDENHRKYLREAHSLPLYI